MKTVIFDFDGTIADSLDVFISVLHELVHREGTVTPADIELMRGMSVREVAHLTKFPLWRLPFMMRPGFQLMRSRIGEIKPCKGMLEAVRAVKAEGYVLHVMSTNNVENIEVFLEKYGLRELFTNIYGDVGVFGKKRMLKRILRHNDLNKSDVIYVGDEVRDIEGAKRAGVRVVSVTWGYNNAAILARHHPDALVNVAEELPATVGRLLQ